MLPAPGNTKEAKLDPGMVRDDRTGIEHVKTSYRGSEPLAFRESSRSSSSHTEEATRLPDEELLCPVTSPLVAAAELL